MQHLADLGIRALHVRWMLGDGSSLSLAANLGTSPQQGDWRGIIPLWCEGIFAEDTLGGHTALFWLT